MQIRGWINRRGPNGWSILAQDPESGSLCEMPENEEDFGLLVEAADLVLSTESNGKLCGGNRIFSIQKCRITGARMLVVQRGSKYILRENLDQRRRADVDLTIVLPFKRPKPVEEY